jgi:hypothetical protein
MSRVIGTFLLALAGCLLVVACGSAAEPTKTSASIAHTSLWPQTRSVGLVDEGTERFLTELISSMSLEEKVGQMIQALDLLRQANAEMSLQIDYRLDQAPTGAVGLAMACAAGCGEAGSPAIEPLLSKAPVGVWHTLKVPLACFREKGVDLGRIAAPMVISSSGRLQLSIAAVSLASDSNGAVCP